MKKILVFLAEGFEEVEALTTIDILRRAGFSVNMVSVSGSNAVKGAHDVEVLSDMKIDDVSFEDVDACVLPGGAPGYMNLQVNEKVKMITLHMNKAGKLVAAICAAPTVLGAFGILKGKKATCYPGMQDGLFGATHSTDKVVVDGNIITSRGVGTAIDFALAIVAYFSGEDTANELAEAIVWH